MPFDFSTLSKTLQPLKDHAEKIRLDLLRSYGGRNIGLHEQSASKLWTKKIKAINKLYYALIETQDVQSFNCAVIANLSEMFTYQRTALFTGSTALTNTEKLLCKLRKNVNNNVDDMLIVVMHCLLLRVRKLSVDIAGLDELDSDDTYTAISEECEALEMLIERIKFAAKNTSYITPLVFYVEIVAWESEANDHQSKIVAPAFFSAYRQKNIAMIQSLKSDLLRQAYFNGDITRLQLNALNTSAKISKTNEIEQLSIICPVVMTSSSFVRSMNGRV